jgi:hypothetical protein
VGFNSRLAELLEHELAAGAAAEPSPVGPSDEP